MKPWIWIIGVLAAFGVVLYLSSSSSGASFVDLGDDSEIPGGGGSIISSATNALSSLFSVSPSTDYSMVTP